MMATPLSPPAPGFGLETMLQLVPFQCSISVCSLPLVLESPTAHTSVGETAATARSSLDAPLTLGLETTLQVVPFQCSISVCWPVPLLNCPTAQMSLVETAVTPFSPLSCVPTLGLATTLQVVPFQCSMRVCEGLKPWGAKLPTAHTSVVETAATPKSSLNCAPGLGLDTTLHLWPSQCRVSV